MYEIGLDIRNSFRFHIQISKFWQVRNIRLPFHYNVRIFMKLTPDIHLIKCFRCDVRSKGQMSGARWLYDVFCRARSVDPYSHLTQIQPMIWQCVTCHFQVKGSKVNFTWVARTQGLTCRSTFLSTLWPHACVTDSLLICHKYNLCADDVSHTPLPKSKR